MNSFDNFTAGLQQAWANMLLFVPKVLLFVVVLVIGYFVAKFLCKVLNRLLDRVGFNRLVERGGIKHALSRAGWDGSDILSKTLFYFIMLFALQLAFGVFGPNPISTLLTGIVAYLPNIFVAIVILIITAAVASGVRQIAYAALGGLSYGLTLARVAAVLIWAIGIFAALNQLNIAPAIVNGLFYAFLAIIAGSAIIAIGGGGIVPMRQRWDRVLGRLEQEAPRVKEHARRFPAAAQEKTEEWKKTVPQPGGSSEQSFHE